GILPQNKAGFGGTLTMDDVAKERVENRAIDYATQYLEKQGYLVENVSRGKRANSEHNGYDLLARKKGNADLRIEVKGCSRPWGIPDPYATEFKDGQLVADFLYVVYFLKDSAPQLCAIPREAFKPDDIVVKWGYRIRSGFKNKKSLEPYMRNRE